MGIRLIALLALVVGALYCLHLLAQDYQAIRMPRLFRLFKRDVTGLNSSKPHVRWKKILSNDPLQCTRLIFCELGTMEVLKSDVERGLVYMLTLEPQLEDKSALDIFKETYNYGRSKQLQKYCRTRHPTCPFSCDILINLFQYIIKHNL